MLAVNVRLAVLAVLVNLSVLAEIRDRHLLPVIGGSAADAVNAGSSSLLPVLSVLAVLTEAGAPATSP